MIWIFQASKARSITISIAVYGGSVYVMPPSGRVISGRAKGTVHF
jgi:hypothetical protein